MEKITVLPSIGAAMFRGVVGSNNRIIGFPAVRGQARGPCLPERIAHQHSSKRRMSSLPPLLLAGIASLWMMAASAQQSQTLYVEPMFLFRDPNIVTQFETSPSAALADVQAARGGCSGSSCVLFINLTAVYPPATGGIIQDGVPFQYTFDAETCDANWQNCSTAPHWNSVSSTTVCPASFAGGEASPSSGIQDIWCQSATTYTPPPPPNHCQSCFGNPIYASSGEKLQVETDYSGATGLQLTRTYLSSNGYFASVLTQSFVNDSTPAGTTSSACYPASWTAGSQMGYYCFPYISAYPYVNGGVTQYQLRGADGRSIQFTGPNNAITQNADINDRVTQISVGGVTEWQVKREDDSTEIYSAAGALIQRTLRGGKFFSFTYSTSSTPTNVAPHPGLLIGQTDTFGHALSWAYNSSGQMTLMTDPGGGSYQYNYDSSANLVGVIYPDGSSKAYEYNESANTGGASLPTALTGITDESAARYATFQYSNAGPYFSATNTQHAGGVLTVIYSLMTERLITTCRSRAPSSQIRSGNTLALTLTATSTEIQLVARTQVASWTSMSEVCSTPPRTSS
jgi:YD repeat-containing protein